MSNKITNIFTRMIQKHDKESEWLKAIDFIPLSGEIIVYDEDDNYNYKRIKIGDGITKINDLSFVTNNPDWNQTDPTKGDYIKNKPDFEGLESKVVDIETLVGNAPVSDQITEVLAMSAIDNEEIDRICGMTIISEDDYTDVTTGINYKLYVDNGKLHMAEVE